MQSRVDGSQLSQGCLGDQEDDEEEDGNGDLGVVDDTADHSISSGQPFLALETQPSGVHCILFQGGMRLNCSPFSSTAPPKACERL